MSLKEQLMSDMKQAMKDREAGKLRLAVIRMVRASIRNKEIDEKVDLSDADVLEIIAKEVKMRRDALVDFKKGNRADLVQQTETEIEILKTYLPTPLSEEELRALVKKAIVDSAAQSPKDMGRVMALLMPQIKGRADGKRLSGLVREMLGA